MMQKTLIAAAASLLIATPTFAADLPVKAPRAAPVAAAVYNWTGFYIGGHVGYGWGEIENTNINGTAPFPAGTVNNADLKGAFGGAQVGFNYQFDRLVLGIESEFSWSGIDGEDSGFSVVPGFTATRFNTAEHKIDHFITLAGRLGIASGNWLFYGKGGAVWAKFETNSQTVNPAAGNALVAITGGDETRFGWLAGAGIEWGFASNWSAKIEYNYLDFGTEQIERYWQFGTGTPSPLLRDSDLHLHTVKFGINYRFNVGGPVVARY